MEECSMFYISRDYGDNTYGVTNTKNNYEIRGSLQEILDLSKESKVHGVSQRGVVTNTFRGIGDLYKFYAVRYKLLYSDIFPYLTFDVTDKDIILKKVNSNIPISNFNVPDWVTVLGDNCFEDTNLQSINISDSVDMIGAGCFNCCSNLVNINLPDSITFLGDNCFKDCSLLKEICIPSSVVDLGNYCFSSCYQLKRVDASNVICFGDFCFNECFDLDDMILSKYLISIGDSCFRRCFGLRDISLPSSVKFLGSYCFKGCMCLENFNFNPKFPLKVGGHCFDGCVNLRETEITELFRSFKTSRILRGMDNLSLIGK